MKFVCDTSSRLPIYRQLVEQVRRGVATGRLKPGERLPSVRQLSRELVVNPNTVARAYSELEQAGVLHTRQGLGAFVAEPSVDTTKKSRRERLVAMLDELLTEAVHLGFTRDELLSMVQSRLERFQFHGEEA